MTKNKSKKVRFRLPTKLKEPAESFNEYSIFIHGDYKIGKTTLAGTEDKVLFLQCDPEQKAYHRLEILISDWEESRKAIRALKKLAEQKKFPYDRVCIDGAELWYQRCFSYVCEILAIKHPEDLGWGRGWTAIRKEFQTAVLDFLSLPCSRWFTCHSTWREIENRHGVKQERFVPRLPGQADDIILGQIDVILCYDWSPSGRIIRLQESDGCMAGHRLDSETNPHFRHAKTKKPLTKIMVEGNPKFAYKQLLRAFANRYGKNKAG